MKYMREERNSTDMKAACYRPDKQWYASKVSIFPLDISKMRTCLLGYEGDS